MNSSGRTKRRNIFLKAANGLQKMLNADVLREEMTDRDRWKQVQRVVSRVIHDCDPYALFEGGAPEDEWDSEILTIVGRVTRCSSAEAATAAIADIFTSALQPEGFSWNDCAEVGRKLFDALKEESLTEDAEQSSRHVPK